MAEGGHESSEYGGASIIGFGRVYGAAAPTMRADFSDLHPACRSGKFCAANRGAADDFHSNQKWRADPDNAYGCRGQPQQKLAGRDPVAKQLSRTSEGEIIPALIALKGRPHDPDTLEYVGSYIAPIAVLSVYNVDDFNTRAGSGYSKLTPGGICEHIDRLMKQVTSRPIEYCRGLGRMVVNLAEPLQSSSTSIRYFSLFYLHSDFEEICTERCTPTVPFSRAMGAEAYCGSSIYHVFRARDGVEYRLIGNLDARKYPFIDIITVYPDTDRYLKTLQEGRGLKGAEKKQCKILIEQEEEQRRVRRCFAETIGTGIRTQRSRSLRKKTSCS